MDRLICPEPDRDLKRRPLGHKSSGKSVGQVQRWLGLDVTEYFNKRVERAVCHFQAEFGLRADGLVGPRTWAKLCEVHEPQPDPAYDCPPPDDPMPFPEPDPPPLLLPRPDPIAWGGIGIGAAFLLAMLAYWWL